MSDETKTPANNAIESSNLVRITIPEKIETFEERFRRVGLRGMCQAGSAKMKSFGELRF